MTLIEAKKVYDQAIKGQEYILKKLNKLLKRREEQLQKVYIKIENENAKLIELKNKKKEIEK